MKVATRILLADDHKIMREGLRTLIEKHSDFQIVGQAEDGRTTIKMALELKPEVIIMDIGMPDLNGIEATRRIKAVLPETRIIALSMYYDKRFVLGMLGAGASGYLTKDCAPGELVKAIQTVSQNRMYLSPRLAGIALEKYENYPAKKKKGEFASLTERQREILQALSEGKNTKQIAYALKISIKTVETHILHIKEKLDIHSTAELTRYAIREGLTFLEPGFPSSNS